MAPWSIFIFKSVRAGLEDKGRKGLKKDVRVEQKVSVALLASIDDNCLGGGSKDETIAESREGGTECRLHRKVTCGGGMFCVRNGGNDLRCEFLRWEISC